MGDKPEISADQLKKDGLKKTTTHVAGAEVDSAAVEGIKKQWAGSFEETAKLEGFNKMNFADKFVAALKEKAAGEQAEFFANGILTGIAFAE